MKTYLQCRCSSIRACGERVVVLPASLTNFREKLNQRIPIYQISENFPLSSITSLSIERVCERCYDIICNSCGAKFRIFIHGHKNFLQFPLMGKNPNKYTCVTPKNSSPSDIKERGQNDRRLNHHTRKHQNQHLRQGTNAIIAEDNKDLPIPLRSFILMKAPKLSEENEKKDELINFADDDDDDFDLMFSNSKETLVGSFHNASLGLPNFPLYS